MFAKTYAGPPSCLSNTQVWLDLDTLSNVDRAHDLILQVQDRVELLRGCATEIFREIADRASQMRKTMPCKVDLTRFAIGDHGSLCFPLIFADNQYWLIRIRYARDSHDTDSNPQRGLNVLQKMMETAVYSMEFLGNQTDIWVPRVHFYGHELFRGHDAVFIVMDFIDGAPLTREALNALDTKTRKDIYDQLAHVTYEMSKVCLPQIGCITSTSYPETLGPKYTSSKRELGPFTDTKIYYRMLAVRYWEDAVAGMPDPPRTLKYWSWPLSTYAEKDLFCAFLHMQLATHLEQQPIPPLTGFCLQNPALFDNLSNYLFRDGTLVAVVDWEECATVPLWGFHPVPFAEQGEEDWALEMLEEIQIREGHRGDSLRTLYAMPSSLCMRSMEMLMADCERWRLAPDLYGWIYNEPLMVNREHPEDPERGLAVMQRALDHMKVWIAR